MSSNVLSSRLLRSRLLLSLLLPLWGCSSAAETVTMAGTVFDAPKGDGAPVADITVTTTDLELQEIGTTVSDQDGVFYVDVPAGEDFFVTVSGDGYLPTSFSGVAGVTDFVAGTDIPWIATESWVTARRDTFNNCPSAADAGTVVTGETRTYIAEMSLQEMPIAREVRVAVIGSDGEEYPTCYLDDDGVSLEDGSSTGGTGEFAVFGVPAGPLLVGLYYTQDNGLEQELLYRFLVEENSLVPIFPAVVYTNE